MRKETAKVKVVKRDGTSVPVSFEKVLSRIERQSYKLDNNFVVPFAIAQKVLNGIYDGVTTRELDNLAVETAAYMGAEHPDYSKLAARLAVSAMHKETNKSFSKTMQQLYDYIDPATNEHAPLVSREFNERVQRNAQQLDAAIVHNRDYMFEYFGYKTLSNAYLLRMNGKIAERPQYMYMRAAVGIHGEDIESALKSYDLMSEGWFTHATPTLFNAGTPHPQLSSCFLLKMHDDSINGIFETLAEAATISKNAGGIGIAASSIRAAGTYIKGTGGTSNGLVPFLRIFNETARSVDQGGGKRKGAFAIYLEPWHGDIFEFLDLKKNHGKEEMRARDLFYGLWVPDLFMQRVELDLEWSLMCPKQCPGLDDVYGEEFIALYEKYEAEGKFLRKVRAQEIWTRILDAQTETGTPYLLYKDSVNKKSNQANIGTIKTSNLCLAGDTKVQIRVNGMFGGAQERIETLESFDSLVKTTKMFGIYEGFGKVGKLPDFEIVSYNISTGRKEYKPVTASAQTNPSARVMRITDEATGKSITCTPEHQVYTLNRGYVMAKDLKEDDTLEII